jgi:hypothetical protein
MHRPQDIQQLLRKEPFEQIMVALSDGRSVLIRHPHQAVVSERHLYVGLAKITSSGPLKSPKQGEDVAPEWILVNLVQLTTIRLSDGNSARRRPKPS